MKQWTESELKVLWLGAIHVEMGLKSTYEMCNELVELMKNRSFDSIRKKLYNTRKELNIPEDIREQLRDLTKLAKLEEELNQAKFDYLPDLNGFKQYGWKLEEEIYATEDDIRKIQEELSKTCIDPNMEICFGHPVSIVSGMCTFMASEPSQFISINKERRGWEPISGCVISGMSVFRENR